MRWLKLLSIAALFASSTAYAQLQTWPEWVATAPFIAKQVPPVALVARGIGTNAYYVLEVDETTGRLPVDALVTFTYDQNYGTPGAATLRTAAMLGVGATAVSNANPVPMSDAGGSITVDGTVAATQSGAWSVTATATDLDIRDLASATDSVTAVISAASTVSIENFPTTVDTAFGTPGASTLRTAAMLGVGATAASNANPVPMSDAGGSITVDGTVAATQSGTWSTGATNFPTTVDTNSGVAGASTIRVVQSSRSETATTPLAVRISNGTSFVTPANLGRLFSDSIRNDYTSTAVTTGAWVQLIASTAADINSITLFDSSGQTLELGIGAAASETRTLIIPPGGLDGAIPLRIPSGTRLSIRAISASATTGEINITGLN